MNPGLTRVARWAFWTLAWSAGLSAAGALVEAANHAPPRLIEILSGSALALGVLAVALGLSLRTTRDR